MARLVDVRRSRLLLAGLVVGHLVVISRQVEVGGGASLLEKVVFDLLSPLQVLASASVRALRETWRSYLDLRGVREAQERLGEQVRGLQTLLQEKQQQAHEAERLRQVLDLKEVLPLKTIAAEVVTRDGMPWFRTLTIDRGRQHGVRLDAPVISPTGVVGRVIALGARAAKVQLLLDRDSGVGVLVDRSRATGVASGQVVFSESGTSELLVRYVPALAEVAAGDLVVTSGLDGIFPKGLVVGRVRSAGTASGLFRENLVVTPSVRFDQLEMVLVIRSERQTPAFTESVK